MDILKHGPWTVCTVDWVSAYSRLTSCIPRSGWSMASRANFTVPIRYDEDWMISHRRTRLYKAI